MGNPSRFWDRIAKRYAKQSVGDDASYQKKLSVTREYLTSSSRVLEFGCGTGTTSIYHAPCVEHIQAIDISTNMLAIAREKANAANVSNIRFKQTRLQGLSSADASWDVVLGMSILHLVESKNDDIQQVYQLLKPEGVFISSTPCIADSSVWFKYAAPLFRWLPFLPTVHVFSERELKESLEIAGFKVEYDWRPGPDKAVFIVARKPAEARSAE